ncbi:MAG: SRPBCC domain-containing protein [Pseudomonadota bacterium]
MQVETSIAINAPSHQVWHHLTDPASLMRDTGILKIEGRPAPNARLKIWSEVAPERAFTLRVTAFAPDSRMVWRGGMPFGLFTGERSFDLTERNGATELRVTERFSGPMAPLITRSMPDLQPSFDKFAKAIKQMSEGDLT